MMLRNRPSATRCQEGETEVIRLHFQRPPSVVERPAERVLEGYGDPVRVGDRVSITLHVPGQRWGHPCTPDGVLMWFGGLDNPEYGVKIGPAHYSSGRYDQMVTGSVRKFALLEARPKWWLDLNPGDSVRLVKVMAGHRPELRANQGATLQVWGRGEDRDADKALVCLPSHNLVLPVSMRYLEFVAAAPAESEEGAG